MGIFKTMSTLKFIVIGVVFIFTVCKLISLIVKNVHNKQYNELSQEIKRKLGINDWLYMQPDDVVLLKSAKSVDNYQPVQYFKNKKEGVLIAKRILQEKAEYASKLRCILVSEMYADRPMYNSVREKMETSLNHCEEYEVLVKYVSPSGRSTRVKKLYFTQNHILELLADPSVLMSKAEIKEQVKEALEKKKHIFYNKANSIIDFANENKDTITLKSDRDAFEKQMSSLFDKAINGIKKIKDADSEEWDTLDKFISSVEDELRRIVRKNKRISEYYESADFKDKIMCKKLRELVCSGVKYCSLKGEKPATLVVGGSQSMCLTLKHKGKS